MLVQQIIVYAGIAVGVSALSIIYKKLVDNVPIPSTPANTGATYSTSRSRTITCRAGDYVVTS